MIIKVFANLREICGGSTVELDLDKECVIDILEHLVQKFPRLEDEIFTSERRLKPFVHVFINGQNIIHQRGLDTIVCADDQFALFPPVAGG